MNLSTCIKEQKLIGPRPQRYQVKLPVEITHHVFVGTRATQGVCTDLNEHGFGANIPQPLAVGEIVKVALSLPADPLHTCARVVYRNGHHYGFYFVEIEPEQRAKLTSTLSFLGNNSNITVQ